MGAGYPAHAPLLVISVRGIAPVFCPHGSERNALLWLNSEPETSITSRTHPCRTTTLPVGSRLAAAAAAAGGGVVISTSGTNCVRKMLLC